MAESESPNGTNGNTSDEYRAALAEFRSLQMQYVALSESDVLLDRLRWAKTHGVTFDGLRDEYDVLGYDRFITNRQYREEYYRGGIAGRVIDAFPNATWRGKVELIEDEDPKKTTAFEQAYIDLDKRLGLQAKFLRVDKLSLLSPYAVLLLGAPGELNTELPKVKGKSDQLLYLSVFSGGGGPGGDSHSRGADLGDVDCTIHEFETDPRNERFGLPRSYQLKRTDVSSPAIGLPVHWTRIIHVAEGVLDNEVYGLPGLERIWNLLIDLRKVTGGGAEAFWLRANQGFHLNIDKDMAMSDPSLSLDELKKQIDKYKHGIDRWIRTKGTDVNVLGSDVANFANPVDVILTQIAGAKAIPKRILTGSEMGELASSQDRDNWQDQVNGRQLMHAEPNILRPFVDRCIDYGYLPTPTKGEHEYDVRWSPISKLSQTEKNATGQAWASINATMGDTVFTRDEIRETTADKGPLDEEQMAQIEEEKQAKIEQQQEMMKAQAQITNGDTEKEDKKDDKKDDKAFPRAAEERRYSSTEIRLPRELHMQIVEYGLSIPEFDLAEDGREETPHVTLKYGLHTQDARDVEVALSNADPPLQGILGKTKAFTGVDHDVLYIEVFSRDLQRVNAQLSNALVVTDTYPTYVPHLTVAYLKRGHAVRYVNDARFEGERFTAEEVVFTPPGGDANYLSLRTPVRYAETARPIVHPTPPLAVPESGVLPALLSAMEKAPAPVPVVRVADLSASDDEIELIRLLAQAIRAGHADVVGVVCGFEPRTHVAPTEKRDEPADVRTLSAEDVEERIIAYVDELEERILGGPGSGHFGHAGRPGEVGGSAPQDGGAERAPSQHAHQKLERGSGAEALKQYQEMKNKWAKVNNALLEHLDTPKSPTARAHVEELKSIVKDMHRMDLSGTSISDLPGVGVPGPVKDVVVVGAGPGGLAAATMAGTDGLNVLVLEAQETTGGQPKSSVRIENYMGFGVGVSGPELSRQMREQAERVTAEIRTGARVVGISYDSETDLKTVTLSNGEQIETRSVVLAGGVEFNKNAFPGAERAIYADGPTLADVAKGQPVVIAGGSNAAAQAALGAARRGSHVTIVSRSPLEKGMSDLPALRGVLNHPKIEPIIGPNIEKWEGSKLTLSDGRTLETDHLGIFYGGKPKTDWLPKEINRAQGKDAGKVDVGLSLETSMPGVFAVGDIRKGSKGRVGIAVGDGQMAAAGVHDYFDRIKDKLQKIVDRKSTPLRRAASMFRTLAEKAKFHREWDEVIDLAFAVDEEYPFLWEMENEENEQRALGGPGSGNFGHAGRPGEIGGSASSSASATGEKKSQHAHFIAQPTVTGADAPRLSKLISNAPAGVLDKAGVKRIESTKTQEEASAKIEDYMLRHYNHAFAAEYKEGELLRPVTMIDTEKGFMISPADAVASHLGLSLKEYYEKQTWREMARSLREDPQRLMADAFARLLTGEAAQKVMSLTNPLTAIIEQKPVQELFRKWGWQ